MSRFSVFVHEHFGTGTPNETAADIIVRHIPDTGQLAIVKEVASDVVAVMEGTGIPGDEKKKLATLAVNFALVAAHVSVPASIVSYIIEEAVLLLKGGKASTPVAAPADPYYTAVFHSVDEAKAAGKSGDQVYGLPDGSYRLIPGGVGGTPITTTHPDWTLATTI